MIPVGLETRQTLSLCQCYLPLVYLPLAALVVWSRIFSGYLSTSVGKDRRCDRRDRRDRWGYDANFHLLPSVPRTELSPEVLRALFACGGLPGLQFSFISRRAQAGDNG